MVNEKRKWLKTLAEMGPAVKWMSRGNNTPPGSQPMHDKPAAQSGRASARRRIEETRHGDTEAGRRGESDNVSSFPWLRVSLSPSLRVSRSPGLLVSLSPCLGDSAVPSTLESEGRAAKKRRPGRSCK